MPHWFGRFLIPGLFALIFIVVPVIVITLSMGDDSVLVQPEAESALPRK